MVTAVTDQPKPFPSVQGRCPACGNSTLFVGTGGWITCSLDVCPNPSAADELLHGEHTAATPRELELRQRHAWITAGMCPMCVWEGTDGRLCPDCTTTVRALPARKRREWRRYEPPATGTPIQSHGYTPAGLLGIAPDDEPDDTDLTEADIDRMMATGTPVQIVTEPPGTYAVGRVEFHEPDEDPAAVQAAFDAGEKNVTAAPAHDSGPTVAECATADRNYDIEQETER
jgi:hypothetical protein